MDIESELNQYVRGRRNSVRERELERELRELPEEERFRIIWDILPHTIFGLHFAKRCLRERKYFLAILMRGLENPNPQGIKRWLECVIAPLGVRRVLSILKRELETNPRGVYHAVYWMPNFVRDTDLPSIETLREIRSDVRYHHIDDEPHRRTDGKTSQEHKP